MVIKNLECDIRGKAELCSNLINNYSIPLGLPNEPTVCRIYVIKIIDSVGGIIRNKPIQN